MRFGLAADSHGTNGRAPVEGLRVSLAMLILSGPLPPPLNGQSVTFQYLVNECAARGLAHRVVAFPSEGDRIGFTLGRAFRFVGYLFGYVRALLEAPRGSSIYLVLGQSYRG